MDVVHFSSRTTFLLEFLVQTSVILLTATCLVVYLLPPANEVCEGYVFTDVCLSMGGCGSHPPGRHPLGRYPPWQTPPGRHTPTRQTHTPEQTNTPGQTRTPGQTPPRQTPPRQTPPRQTPRSTSGRYASYWNAFLFINEILWQEIQTSDCI